MLFVPVSNGVVEEPFIESLSNLSLVSVRVPIVLAV